MVNDRYKRLARFKPIGPEGIKQLRSKRVAIVGVGALGTVLAETLTRSGIGELTLIDRDYVDTTNLQRQTLFTERDVRQSLPKAVAAARRLQEINSAVNIRSHIADIGADNAKHLLSDHDLLLDGTDNFETRRLINDFSIKYQVPWIYGAATAAYGLSFTILPGKTPCLSCLYRWLPIDGETCETAGVIGPAPQFIASIQATEALKILTGNHDALRHSAFYVDLWTNDVAVLSTEGMKRSDCPTCGEVPAFPYLEGEGAVKSAILCGRETVQIRPAQGAAFDYPAVAQRLWQSDLKVTGNPFLTQISVHGHRLVLFQDGRALIHGTKDETVARRLYQKYFGG